jgi:hypothetical protein
MPMQKSTYPGNAASDFSVNCSFSNMAKALPSEHTLRRILAFAAMYRTQQVSKNQYINYYLN